MDHIKDIVHNIIKASSPENDWKGVIMQNWPTIIGSLASRVFIEKIYQDTIVLSVTDSCWMQELYLLSEILKNKINQTINQPRIKTIRFKYGTKKNMPLMKKKQPEARSFTPRKLTAAELAALSKIQDQELSEVLARFLQKCHHST